jgi:hypothetical protein
MYITVVQYAENGTPRERTRVLEPVRLSCESDRILMGTVRKVWP